MTFECVNRQQSPTGSGNRFKHQGSDQARPEGDSTSNFGQGGQGPVKWSPSNFERWVGPRQILSCRYALLSKCELQHRCAAGPTTATMLHAGPALCCWCMENFTGSTTPYQVLGHTDHTGPLSSYFSRSSQGPPSNFSRSSQGPPSNFSRSSGPSVKLWPP